MHQAPAPPSQPCSRSMQGLPLGGKARAGTGWWVGESAGRCQTTGQGIDYVRLDWKVSTITVSSSARCAALLCCSRAPWAAGGEELTACWLSGAPQHAWAGMWLFGIRKPCKQGSPDTALSSSSQRKQILSKGSCPRRCHGNISCLKMLREMCSSALCVCLQPLLTTFEPIDLFQLYFTKEKGIRDVKFQHVLWH